MTHRHDRSTRRRAENGLIRSRTRWLLIVIAISIIALAALALATTIDQPPDPTVPADEPAATDQPVADFEFTCDGTSCSFRDTSTVTGPASSRQWAFGDGGIATGDPITSHTYETAGIYRVSLSITSESGSTDVVSKGVTPGAVQPENRVADVAPPWYAFGPHVGSSGGWDLVDPIFTSAHISPHPEAVIHELNAARADGKSIILLLARSAPNYKNPDGTFSLEKWRAEIDRYAHIDFTPWIEDGTLLAHYLISEPMSRGRWGGQVLPVEVLDEMARYSKQYWPTLLTTVREQPTDLLLHAGGYETPVPGWDWSYLDAGWARYLARKGPIDEFVAAEVEAARAQDLGLLFGMNVLAGGDGSSEEVGYDGGWLMSPAELMEYGTALIEEPYGCANIMWHLNHNGVPYFDIPEIDAAMEDLAEIARARRPVSCTEH